MFKSVRAKILASMLMVGVVTVLFVWYVPVSTEGSAHDESIAFWRTQIRSLGPVVAYQEFSCPFTGEADLKAHSPAHAFGAALYMEKGLDAAAVCDDRFQYGCLHEFFGRAIAERGLAVVPALDLQCMKSVGTQAAMRCEHGLGHGILAYFGYDQEGRDRAVESCHGISGDAGACASGVFMEYFNQTMLADQANIPKKSVEQLFALCASIPLADRAGCVVELPRQWRKSLFENTGTSTKARKDIGTWCESYRATPSLYRACAEGMGNDLYILTGGDETLASNLCAESAQSPQALAYCRAQVSNLLESYKKSEAHARTCLTADVAENPKP